MKDVKKEQLEKQLERVAKYFIKTPEAPHYLSQQITMIAGGILILYAIVVKNPTAIIAGVIGLILLLVGFSKYGNKKSEYKKLYNKAEPKASDEEMDRLLSEGKQQALSEAYERLDIDPEDTSTIPLMIDGPEKNSLIGSGKDKILRFRHHNILLFFLTDHNIATFHCTLDLGCSEILKDKTTEFPYTDITNLATETTTDTFYYLNNEKSRVEGIQSLSLYTSGGKNTTVNYILSKGANDPDGYKLPQSDAEKTIKAIRKRLKEYKDRFSTS